MEDEESEPKAIKDSDRLQCITIVHKIIILKVIIDQRVIRRTPLQYLAGYYHINDGYLVDTNK